jgi:transcriptional regulator with XRE-family HTH domain
MAGGREKQAGLVLFAAELKAVRTRAGLSQEELALKINYSASLVAMVESCRRAPALDFAKRCDDVLGTPGTLARLQHHGRTAPFPVWFLPYAEIEATAAQLRLFEHALVPGLLQTEDYARAILSVDHPIAEDDLEERVAARMERQSILAREKPPRLWVVLDEGVLHRQIGSAKIMQEQLLHVADMASQPNITVEVVPFSAGAHSGLLGACVIADINDGSRVGYLETLAEGFILETPSALANVVLIFDTLRSEAVPRKASRDLIMKRAESHGAD